MILPTPDHYSTAATPATDTPPSITVGRRPVASGLAPGDRAELAALVRRAQAGEPAAQTALVRQYTRRIGGYVRLIIRQPDAVEDVVQMIFIKMFRRLGRLRDSAAFESWLFCLARNTAVDFIRRRRCRPSTVPVETEAMEIPDPSDASVTSEILDALQAALTQVGPTDRQLVTHFVQGTSYQNLARQNGLTIGAVKARLHRMRPFLRSYVGHVIEARAPSAARRDAGPRRRWLGPLSAGTL